MRKTLAQFDRCWHVAGAFHHDGQLIGEDTRYKIAFSLWKESAVLETPGVKDVTTQDSGPEKVTSGVADNAFNTGEDIPF